MNYDLQMLNILFGEQNVDYDIDVLETIMTIDDIDNIELLSIMFSEGT